MEESAEMSENHELTESDRQDLEAMGIDPDTGEAAEPTRRTLLEIWQEVLANVEKSKATAIPMNVAHKVVASWPKLSYQDTVRYHELYHDHLLELREVLNDLIARDPAALSFTGEGEDLEANGHHYQDLLVSWNLVLEHAEMEWRAEQEDSHIRVAAIVDARHFFFASDGLTGHLDSIGFQLSDEDFMAALQAARAEEGR